MAEQPARRTWLPKDNDTLMGLWDAVGSVILIALMMERSASSIQTQASRLGLPPRAEEKDKHRRRWSDEDDAILDELEIENTDKNGRIDVKSIAAAMGRSIDAILTRLEALHGEDAGILSRVLIPESEIREVEKPLAFKGAKPGEGKKKCLRCYKEFWSEGKHNWVCVPCKRSEDWVSS